MNNGTAENETTHSLYSFFSQPDLGKDFPPIQNFMDFLCERCEDKQINLVLQLEYFWHHEINLISLCGSIPEILLFLEGLVADTLTVSEQM